MMRSRSKYWMRVRSRIHGEQTHSRRCLSIGGIWLGEVRDKVNLISLVPRTAVERWGRLKPHIGELHHAGSTAGDLGATSVAGAIVAFDD